MTDLAALRRLAEDGRCDRCHSPLAASVADGCVAGNCSLRPLPPVLKVMVPRDELRTLLTALDRLAAGVRESWRQDEFFTCQLCGVPFDVENWDPAHTPDCPVPLAEAVGRGEVP